MSCTKITLKGTKCQAKAKFGNYCGRHIKTTENKITEDKLETYTITFGDQAENSVGMKKIGQQAEKGFTLKDLQDAQKWFLDNGINCDLINVSTEMCSVNLDNISTDEAFLLVAHTGLKALCNPDLFLHEQKNLKPDTMMLSRGKVKNKIARHNLCFDNEAAIADYSTGQGTIHAFDTLPQLNMIKNKLPEILGEKAADLKAEGNYYYDIHKCGIGYHGDAERKMVVGIRVGETMPLRFQWFYKSQPVGDYITFDLKHGDIYIMSEKTVGTDWKKKNIPTLRHAAGCDKYIVYKKKNKKAS